jgi:hypothetical protein
MRARGVDARGRMLFRVNAVPRQSKVAIAFDGGASSRRRDASWERTLRTRASQKPRASAYDVLDGVVIPFERVDETTFHRDAFIGKGGTRSPVMENLPSPFPRILLAGSGEAAPESRPPRASIRIVAHAFERALTHLTS